MTDDVQRTEAVTGVNPEPTDEARSAKKKQFVVSVEALLFAAHEPLAPSLLQSLNGQSGCSISEATTELNRRFEADGHPMRIRKVAGGYQMHLLSEYAPIIDAHLVKIRTQRLSRAGLETLAIIAYRQPCSTPEIEEIRGVASDGVLRTLLERRLVTISGRSEGPGRPLLYGTTREFLRYFGLDTLDDLPSEDELEGLLVARFSGENAPADAESDILNRFILKRGPEQAEPLEPPEHPTDSDQFMIRQIVFTSENGGWDGDHVAPEDSQSESTAPSTPLISQN